jgi:hypothetical protein
VRTILVVKEWVVPCVSKMQASIIRHHQTLLQQYLRRMQALSVKGKVAHHLPHLPPHSLTVVVQPGGK